MISAFSCIEAPDDYPEKCLGFDFGKINIVHNDQLLYPGLAAQRHFQRQLADLLETPSFIGIPWIRTEYTPPPSEDRGLDVALSRPSRSLLPIQFVRLPLTSERFLTDAVPAPFGASCAVTTWCSTLFFTGTLKIESSSSA
jgi:hypothetical protein